ncbi:MAG: HAD family hydrolase [Ruminococcus sp.]|nr:HAD family hydrolase [Ruminococcus sp.]
MFEDITKVLLITDMDGTFLPNSKIPSERNLKAVNELMRRGGRFSIATGRSLQASQLYFESVSVNCPIIMCNGGMVYDIVNQRQIYDVYLPESAKVLVKRVITDIPLAGCEVLPIDAVYVPNMTEMERAHCDICQVEPVICSVDEIPPDWYKVLFAREPEKLGEIVEYVEKVKDAYKDIDFVISAPMYYEMLPKGISKGSALNELKRACGMEDYTVIAVGDYNNDIEMLETADIGFCPSNAVRDVKAAADIVLDVSCEQDAIAKVVEYIFDKVHI